MPNFYSNEVIEKLIWEEICDSACAQDFLDYTHQFSAKSCHWFSALDQAGSTFSPDPDTPQDALPLYGRAFERVREFALHCKEDRDRAIAFFNLGKMAHRGLGTPANRDESIRFYKLAIDLGEPRAVINCASIFDQTGATPSDLAFADELFRRALEKNEPAGSFFQAARLPSDHPERFALNLKGAELGCPTAMVQVGVALLGGDYGQEKDISLGISWLQRAASAGNSDASFLLADHYESEEALDPALTLEWARLGAEQGHPAAMRLVGLAYLVGREAEKDESQGLRWLRRAAVLQDQVAQFLLGLDLMTDNRIAARSQRLGWLRRAADAGHGYAAWQAALAYREGKLCDRDLVASHRYCEISARAGCPEAQGQLGLNYYHGDGVGKDFEQAHKWISLSALQGDARGIYLLGFLYDEGVGCEKDSEKAFQLYREAAAKGEVDAIRRVGNCYYLGHGVAQDVAEAIAWIRKAAEQGQAIAMINLGWMLREGVGVLSNCDEAIKWFEKAADLGEPSAMVILARMYETGNGVEESEDLCRRWMSRAAMLDHAPAKEWIKAHLPEPPEWLDRLVNLE
jgi:TPR repeat protein